MKDKNMLGWLQRRATKRQITLCTEDTKRAIDAASEKDIALTLAHVAFQRQNFWNMEKLLAVLRTQPELYIFECTKSFWMLRNFRDLQQQQTARLHQSIRQAGGAMDEITAQVQRADECATMIWMSTIGTAVVPEQLNGVQSIWKRVQVCSTGELKNAIAKMQAREQWGLQNGIVANSPWNSQSTGSWLEMCRICCTVLN